MNYNKTIEELILDLKKLQIDYDNTIIKIKHLENISAVLFSLDTNGVFTYISQYITVVSGFRVDEILGNPFIKFVHPEDVPELMNRFKQTLNGTISFHEFRIIDKDNSVHWVRTSSNVNNINGKPIGIDGMMSDITERKLYERIINEQNEEISAQNEELTQNNLELQAAKERAEESDKLKSAFLANMSHEIRTPMNGILGFTDLLKSHNLTTEKKDYYISIIEKSGDRLLNIINNIIDISKIESGQMEIHKTELNINEQIEFIYNFFEHELLDKKINFSFNNFFSPENSTIITDKEKIVSILSNLIKNAIKCTNKGSIDFGYEFKYGCLEFFIKDTGIGIPNDKLDIIFERFRQADTSDKRAIQGAGLGLSIAKSYVEMLGGKIWVESKENIGSTFYFTIPYLRPYKNQFVDLNYVEFDTDIDTTNMKKIKILIVEDDNSSIMLLKLLLEEYSSEILTTEDGKTSLDIIKNNPDIDLIFMDVRMPIMDGYDATREIRKFNKDVIIITQTANALDGDKEKALNCGANEYITKPIRPKEINNLIEKYFN